jgi:3-amino-4-hydroxybenzoic acid synthase
MKFCWLDLRSLDPGADGALADAVRTEAVHQRIDAVVAADPAQLAGLPPTVTKVLMPGAAGLPEDLGAADIVIVDATRPADYAEVAARQPAMAYGRYVEVTGPDSLDLACRCARTDAWTVLNFRDPTKIPLEIVLAAAVGAEGSIITMATDPTDAAVLFGVLEHGSDGVLMAPRAVGDATRLKAASVPPVADLELVELTVTGVEHVGMGERACIDTCSYLHQDEGILVGSHARGMLLCASETHPLPYMPTRPFRVNAGALMSYTLAQAGHTRYLSELHAGSKVLAVDVKGAARIVTVGRAKIETRPLLSISAVAPDGRIVNAIVQDDWHVRVLGPAGVVLNSTALRPGDVVLGYLPEHDRHVGYPIDETCHEQ